MNRSKAARRPPFLALSLLASAALVPFPPEATALAADRPAAVDPDADGDGLPDFQETHKYRTDPRTRDTDGDGTPDGDWRERREFTYSVRAVIRVMPPYSLDALDDDYQDARVLDERPEYAELEIVLYPLNSNAEVIKGSSDWQMHSPQMKRYLAPGVTTNWDDAMRDTVLHELAAAGIHPDKLSDRQVVEQVSRWLFNRSRHVNMFCTFYVDFPNGTPRRLPGVERAFHRDRGDPSWSFTEQLQHELFGSQMFARKTYGTCTSAAVYQTTVLRALGIPTRMILCIPPADGSHSAQVDMLDRGITHRRVRRDAVLGVLSGGNSFSSHTFCEVFVGGRWQRLNYTTLGQNILEPNYLGMMVKVHAFDDLSKAKLAPTWGARYAKGLRDDFFPHSNPYRLIEVSDEFGEHASIPNPPVPELTEVTIEKAYWPDSAEAPEEIRRLGWSVPPGGAHFFVHGREWLQDAGDYLQYKLFMRRADRKFLLRAKDRPDVPCRISANSYTNASKNLRELEVLIPAEAYAEMERGVPYTLHPVNGANGYNWKVPEGLILTRD